ncbi:MAG: histidinol phosphatase [Clostridiales bacterium]|nr:histidinol phosphatase [Clostridiales bacterium]
MKKLYRYETHVHTKEGSACASASGREMTRAHIEAGYSGMIVTDHFFNGHTAVPKHLPWKARVNRLLRGYENALDEAKGTGFQVFFAWEYTHPGGNDFLTYGLGKEFLLKYPDVLSWRIEKYFDIVHEEGGFIVQAHPFREAFYIDAIRLFPEYTDAVEVINASHDDPKFDARALAYARKHSLLQISGSDSHHIDGLYGGGMEFDYEIKSIDEFIDAVKRKDGVLMAGNNGYPIYNYR